jgi:phage tail sheath gpL-like
VYGGKGAGTAANDTLYQITDRAAGLNLFSTGFVSEFIREWYQLTPTANLYAYGIDDSTWVENTWTLTVALVAPATEAEGSGFLVLRKGEVVIPVQVVLGDSIADIVAKAITAINASAAPVSAAAGGVGEVVITHDFAGASYNRWPVSVQHFLNRDEPFPAGITASIVNEETGVGEATAFPTLPDDTPDLYLVLSDIYTSGLYLTSLNDAMLALWQRNRYPLATMQIHSTNLAELATLFDSRNDGKIVVRSSLNSPTPAAVSLARFAARIADRATEQPNRSFINASLEMVAPTISLDPQEVQNVGVSPIKFVGINASIVSTNTLRRKNDAGDSDFSQFKLGKVMTAAQVARELLIAIAPFHGKIKVPDEQSVSIVAKDDVVKPKFVRSVVRDVITASANKAWLSLPDSSVLDKPGAIQVLDLVELGEDVGWDIQVAATIAREVAVFDILFQAL